MEIVTKEPDKDAWIGERRKRTIIGVAGRKGHGKDISVSFLLSKGYVVVRFADPIKTALGSFMKYCGMGDKEVASSLEGDMKEIPNTIFGGRTARYAMQTLGTEWGRALVWDDIWTAAYKMHIRTNKLLRVVTPDVRFPNEVEALHSLGGIIVRVSNPRLKKLDEGAPRHDSEEFVGRLKVDADVVNDGTVPTLHDHMRAALRRLWSAPEEKRAA
jgi:hypothetical protein